MQSDESNDSVDNFMVICPLTHYNVGAFLELCKPTGDAVELTLPLNFKTSVECFARYASMIRSDDKTIEVATYQLRWLGRCEFLVAELGDGAPLFVMNKDLID